MSGHVERIEFGTKIKIQGGTTQKWVPSLVKHCNRSTRPESRRSALRRKSSKGVWRSAVSVMPNLPRARASPTTMHAARPGAKLIHSKSASALSVIPSSLSLSSHRLRCLQCAYCRRVFCNRRTRRTHRCPGVLETQLLPPITIGSDVVEWADSFKYLGHVLSCLILSCLIPSTSRLAFAKRKPCMGPFLNATGKIRRSFRIHLFRAIVEATLMYGGVLWSLSAAERNRLDVFQMKCLRGICGMLPKKLPDGTFLWPHNDDVRKKADTSRAVVGGAPSCGCLYGQNVWCILVTSRWPGGRI